MIFFVLTWWIINAFEKLYFFMKDYEFANAKSEYADVLQCNNSPSSRTPRGHQFPAAFLIRASGLDKVARDLFFSLYDKVVLSTSERSDWFFLGRDFAIRHSSLILPKCHQERQQTGIQAKPVRAMHVRVVVFVVFVDSWSLDHDVFN